MTVLSTRTWFLLSLRHYGWEVRAKTYCSGGTAFSPEGVRASESSDILTWTVGMRNDRLL